MPYFSGLQNLLKPPTRQAPTPTAGFLEWLKKKQQPVVQGLAGLQDWLGISPEEATKIQQMPSLQRTAEVGKKGVGAAFDILNLPSYAAGGLLKAGIRPRQPTDVTPPQPLKMAQAALTGVKEKTPVMEELPTRLGIKHPLARTAVGLAGEFATPEISDLLRVAPFLFGGTKVAKGIAGEAKEKGIKSMLDITGEGGVTAGEKARLAQKKIAEVTETLKAKKAVTGKPLLETPLGMGIEKATPRPMEEFLQPAKQWPENVASEIENEVRFELQGKSAVPKDIAGAPRWGEYWEDIRGMVSFLKSHGEETNKVTGELYREHIPAGTKWFNKAFGEGTDEIASNIGISENEFMTQLNNIVDLGAAGVSTIPLKTKAIKVPKPKGHGIPRELWAEFEKFGLGEPAEAVGRASPLAGVDAGRPALPPKVAKDLPTAAKRWQEFMDIDTGVTEFAEPVSLLGKTEQAKWVAGLEATTPDKGKPLFYLSEYTKPEDFQDLSPILEKRGLQTQRIVNKVGENSPEAKEWLYDATVGKLYKNLDASFDDQSNWLKTLDEVKGKIKIGSEESALAFDYGEGTIDLAGLKEASPKNWQEIEKFADWSKESYNTLLDFVNKFRTEWKLDPIQPREDYMPHIFEMNSFLSTMTKKASDIKDLSKAPKVPVEPLKKFFRFGEKRLGAAGYKRDAVKAMEQYINSSISHAYSLEPIVNLRGVAGILEEKGIPNAADALRTQADRVANTKDLMTLWAEGVGGAPAVRGLKSLSNKIANSWVGLNVSTVLLQPSGLVNATGRIGVANTLGGLQNMMTSAGRKFADEYSSVLKGRMALPKIDPKLGEKLTEAFGLPWGKLEELTVGAAFHGGVRDILKKGGTLQDAIKWGDEVASTTQGEFRAGLREPIMSEAMGKVGLKFQSWAINTLGELGYDIPQGIRQAAKEGKGLGKITNKNVIRGLEMLAGMIFANRIYSSIGGRKPFQVGGIVPSPVSPLSEVFSPVGQLPDMLVGEMSPQEEADWERRVKNSVTSLLGALTGLPTTQMSKTASGLEAIGKGGSFTAKGKLRFPIEGISEQMRAFLFSPWGTQAGKEYLKTDVFRTKEKPAKDVDWLKGFER